MRVPRVPVPVPVLALRACAVLLPVACGVGAGAAPATAAGPLLGVCQALEPDAGSAGVVADSYPVSTASPWRASRRSRARYVAAAYTRVGRPLALCAVRGRRSTGQAFDLHARMGRGERLVRAAVADPWVAWVTRGRGAEGHDVVHWKRLGDDSRPAARRARGRVVGLVPTVGGRVLLQTAQGDRFRVEVLRRGRAARPVVLEGPGAAAARRGRLLRWTPTDAAITVGRRGRSRREVLPIDPITATLRRRCRPAQALVGPRLTTAAVGVDLFAAQAWAGASGFSSPSVERGLEICAPDGTLASAVLLTLDSSHHDEDDERGWADASVAGRVVLVREERVGGTSGSSTDAEVVRGAWVRDGAGRTTRRRPTLVVAAPAAGAFVDHGELWVSDADGLRRVAVAGSLEGPSTALRVRAADVVVRSTAGDQIVPVRPLAAGAFVAAPFGSSSYGVLAADDVCGYDPGRDPLACTIPADPAR